MTKRETEALEYLMEQARKIQMSPEEATEQRRSFAYGNTAFENPEITRKMVDEEGQKIGL